jgi:hypothetical protein
VNAAELDTEHRPGSTPWVAATLEISCRAALALRLAEPWVDGWASLWGSSPANLRRWLARDRPTANRAALAIVGERPIVEAARGVLARLPEAVACHVVEHAFVVCGGVRTLGWVGPLPRLPRDASILVSLSCAEPEVIAHELAHAWHRDASSPVTAGLSAGEIARLGDGICALAVEDGTIAELAEHQLQAELAADSLSRAWGWAIDTTSGCRGERRRRSLRLEIERRGDSGARRPRSRKGVTE